ncbi:hypothetical protein [Flavobacterium sp. FlaQc-48]|uniref:hypothetical protein n=1 Tax=Flavobacterium sp. FlaQc-48 TaxID=3374181 RepID=UPI0037578B80
MKSLKNVPQIILNAKNIGHPIDFKWTRKKMNLILDPLEGNEELETILSGINHKASVGLTAALLEWIYWRFTGYTTSVNDTEKRIEALWCSIENPEQTDPLVFDLDFEIPASGHINGPLWVALMNVRMIDIRYRKGSFYLQNELVGLVLLARHITPKKSIFDKWFSNVTTELSRLYPCTYNYTNLDETDEAIYDSSNEAIICRDFFFDSEFQYTIEASKTAIHRFIENLDHKANPFLHLTQKAS